MALKKKKDIEKEDKKKVEDESIIKPKDKDVPGSGVTIGG